MLNQIEIGELVSITQNTVEDFLWIAKIRLSKLYLFENDDKLKCDFLKSKVSIIFPEYMSPLKKYKVLRLTKIRIDLDIEKFQKIYNYTDARYNNFASNFIAFKQYKRSLNNVFTFNAKSNRRLVNYTTTLTFEQTLSFVIFTSKFKQLQMETSVKELLV